MQRLCRITVPGLSARDFTTARERLLDEFPGIHEVVATTAPGTLLVIYAGSTDVDAWLATLLDSVAARDVNATAGPRAWRGRRASGDDSAA
jgi:hypothetical protein